MLLFRELYVAPWLIDVLLDRIGYSNISALIYICDLSMIIQPSFNIRLIYGWYSKTFGELSLSGSIDMIPNSNWLGFPIDYETYSLFGIEKGCF